MPLSLIPLGALFPDHIPLIANLLSTVMLFVLSWHLYRLLDHFGCGWAGWVAGCLIILTWWTYSFFSLETILLAGLEMTLLHSYLTGRLSRAGIVGALAVLTRYDAILLVGLLVAHHLGTTRRIRPLLRPAIAFVAILGAWAVFAIWQYGSFLPNTFSAKTGVPGNWAVFAMAIWPKILQVTLGNSPLASGMMLALAMLAPVLMSLRQQQRPLLLWPLWIVLYISAYSYLRIIYAYAWYYYPLIVAAIGLACYSVQRLVQGLAHRISVSSWKWRGWAAGHWLIGGIAAAVLLMWQGSTVIAYSNSHHTSPWTTTREQAYRATADWVTAHTPAQAKIAMLEIGIIGYYSNRSVVDLLGLATPISLPYARSGQWWKNISLIQPDYVIIQNRNNEPAWDTHDDAFQNYILIHTLSTPAYTINIYQKIN